MIFGDNNAVGVTGLPKLEDAEQTGKHRKDGPGHEQGDEPGEDSAKDYGAKDNSEQGRDNKDD